MCVYVCMYVIHTYVCAYVLCVRMDGEGDRYGGMCLCVCLYIICMSV